VTAEAARHAAATLAYTHPAGLQAARQGVGREQLMEVCKRNDEETFAGTSGNDEDAPIPAVRGTTMEHRGSVRRRPVTPAGASILMRRLTGVLASHMLVSAGGE